MPPRLEVPGRRGARQSCRTWTACWTERTTSDPQLQQPVRRSHVTWLFGHTQYAPSPQSAAASGVMSPTYWPSGGQEDAHGVVRREQTAASWPVDAEEPRSSSPSADTDVSDVGPPSTVAPSHESASRGVLAADSSPRTADSASARAQRSTPRRTTCIGLRCSRPNRRRSWPHVRAA